MNSRIIISFASLLVAACASSQPMGAPTGSGEAIHYRETTDSEFVLSTPQGSIVITGDHDALIAWVAVSPDSVHAWYETVSVSSTDPRGVQEPNLSGIIGELFILRLDASGRVETLQTPTFPESLRGVSDLRQQFVDFMPSRPTVPLRLGSTWQDTTVTNEQEDGTRSTHRKIGSYEVAADTVIGGMPAWRIAFRAVITVTSSGPVEGQPGVRSEVQMEGVETGVLTIAKSDGTMITRAREAELAGTVTYRAGNESTQINSRQSYVSRIELVQR